MTDTSTASYAVVHRPARPAATVTRTVTMATLSEAADEIPGLAAWLAVRGQVPAGPPFLRYLVIDMAADLVVQAGFPVTDPVEGDGRVEADVLPAGDYLTAVHVGPYEGLYGATAGLLAHAGRTGLALDHHPTDAGDAWTSRLEWYETDPRVQTDPAGWVTRLEFKLADG